MEYALHREEGFVVITGGPGTGKTTLIDDLLDDLNRSVFNIAKLTGSRLEGSEILWMVGYAFRIPVDGMDKAQILNRIQQHTETEYQRGRRSLLVIDEAQGLTNTALEELRFLTNLRIHGKSLLQILLVGQEELREQLMDKRLEQLQKRIIAACHLEPLTLEQTVLYVLHRLRVAGWQGRPKLKSKLFPLLHKFSHGIPRRINTACSRMLLHGALVEQDEITAKEMQLVISELKTEYLLREEVVAFPDSNNTKLERLTELIEQNMPTNPSPVSVQKTEQEQSESPQSGRPSLTTHEPVIQPESVKQPENTERAEQLETSTSRQQGKKRKMWIDTAPLRGFATTLLLLLSVLVIGLLLASPQELRWIAPEAFWSEIGITKIRDLLFPWTGKTVPQQQDPQLPQKFILNQRPTIHNESSDRPQLPDTDADLTDPDLDKDAQDADSSIPQKEIPQNDLQEIPAVKSDAEIEEIKTNPDHAQTPLRGKPNLATMVEVAFRFNSAEVQPEFQRILDETASSLNIRKNSMTHIIGFTDSVGAKRYNALLSKKRASAVADYLRKKGVSEDQLQIEGRGESELQVDRRGENARNRVVRVYTKPINK